MDASTNHGQHYLTIVIGSHVLPSGRCPHAIRESILQLYSISGEEKAPYQSHVMLLI